MAAQGIEPGTSLSVARNSDHQTTEAVRGRICKDISMIELYALLEHEYKEIIKEKYSIYKTF
jgi:hypothetical protein